MQLHAFTWGYMRLHVSTDNLLWFVAAQHVHFSLCLSQDLIFYMHLYAFIYIYTYLQVFKYGYMQLCVFTCIYMHLHAL